MTATTASASSPWQLQANRASLPIAQWQCAINLGEGMHEVNFNISGGQSPVALWRLRQLQGLPLVDAYVRQSDLFASYAPDPAFPFTTDIYWTLLHPSDYAPASDILQLVVSVRTDKLDTHPELDAVTSSIHSAMEIVRCVSGSAVLTPLNEGFHLVEFATLQDSPEFELTAAGGVQNVSRRLFGHFLEKGVIRRARLFAAVVPADLPGPQVERLCEQLAASDWPLTA